MGVVGFEDHLFQYRSNDVRRVFLTDIDDPLGLAFIRLVDARVVFIFTTQGKARFRHRRDEQRLGECSDLEGCHIIIRHGCNWAVVIPLFHAP